MDYIEQSCSERHKNRKCKPRAAVITSDSAVAYYSGGMEAGSTGDISDWHGQKLGDAVVKSRWPVWSTDRPRIVSSWMLQVEAVIDSVVYSGRSLSPYPFGRARYNLSYARLWKGRRRGAPRAPRAPKSL